MRLINADKFILALMDASLSSTDEDTILDLIDACAENCKVYGGYISSVEGVAEAKRELAKQAAQCVERAMLDDDMFLVKGDTVGWKVRIYGNEADIPNVGPDDYCSRGEKKGATE